ncbi:hypothetical protein Rhopal_000568-T1 [Rhodotorula paludigena]|uniref:Major facilitator superfamily (MFS) profile domain-containing protein n=1 Tax=Rhodotorula paludigena TaxID=86838 RepID=A0AAV5GC13_9BASI|nr:hypothetical protein Rhopal_000568-T1 [Rhodotorula paludigena]
MELKGVPQLAGTLAWIATSALQYGFHIAALNSLLDSLACNTTFPRRGLFGESSCVEMSAAEAGIVTSFYTVGGLAASLSAGAMIERYGKKGTAVRTCGIATVLVPLYLSSVAPPALAGNIGILTQISINVGIFAAQASSIPLSTPGTGLWRIVPLISVAILTSPLVPEPHAVPKPGRVFDVEDEERTPLATDDNGEYPNPRRPGDAVPSMGVIQVLRSSDPAVKRALWTLVATMLFQQFSGINAVMYYSTSILTAVNPANAKSVSLFVTVVNLVMTLPTVYLIDRLGRRSLLVISLTAMCVSTAILAWSINQSHFIVASAGIIAFVVSFAIGLGPIPFVLVGELPPKEAVNWTSNLVVGVAFLPLRDWLAGPDGKNSGTVFYVFTALTAIGAVVVGRLVR